MLQVHSKFINLTTTGAHYEGRYAPRLATRGTNLNVHFPAATFNI